MRGGRGWSSLGIEIRLGLGKGLGLGEVIFRRGYKDRDKVRVGVRIQEVSLEIRLVLEAPMTYLVEASCRG